MNRKWLATLLASWMSLGLAACGGANRTVVIQATPPPAWVDRMPSHPGTLCAVGYSGPTFYQQDCIGNAAKNARGHLADTISATIRTVTIDISDGTRGSFSRDVFVEGSETASEAVLQGSEVESQWYDVVGQRGAPQGCFAMVCIDPSKPIDKMVEQMEKKLPPKTVEQVRANAAATFDELEQEEAKQSKKSAAPPAPPQPAPAPTPPAAEEPTPAAPPAMEPAPPAEPDGDLEGEQADPAP